MKNFILCFVKNCVTMYNMSENSNQHFGHRARMTEKVLNSSSSLADHELLEVLLYSTLPRIDTNPLAHKLIEVFGSIDKVFSASMNELMLVKGVGKKTAENIKICGEIFNRIESKEKKNKILDLTPETFIEYFKEKLKNKQSEELVVLLIDNKRRVIAELVYGQGLHASVNGDVREIAKVISIHSPRYVVFAHNHPFGNGKPSVSDDLATTKLTLLAMAHGATVLDHIIIGTDGVFSYHNDGNLNSIRESFQDAKLINSIKS